MDGCKMRLDRKQRLYVSTGLVLLVILIIPGDSQGYSYVIPDTDQSLCYDTLDTISPPVQGEAFFGQDAQYESLTPSYLDNGNGTVTDLNTGLMWQQALPPEKMSWDSAVAGADTCGIGGYDDWRLPTIKELYSLILFSGTDPSGPDPVSIVPFIDTDYFEFEYGDTLSGERLIDAQYWSSTEYLGLTMGGDSTAFGVNFADGRIKGYPSEEVGPPGRDFLMTSFVRYVRGNDYGENQYVNNGDGTVTDLATGLMWQQSDDGTGRNWEEALAYADGMSLAGNDDWRLPDVHELQSIVDYARSLQETNSPAIDTIFSCTQITDEGGNINYGFYWTGTTHASAVPYNTGTFAAYIAFGEALGWLMTPDSSYVLADVHGAGAQRSDPKCGDPDEYPYGHGPQGDVIRIYNLVRCVRNTGGTGMEEAGSREAPGLRITGNNPFTSTITFICTIPVSGLVDLTVYDSAGRVVDNIIRSNLSSGDHYFSWDPQNNRANAGVYLLRFATDYGSTVIKMLYTGS